MTKSKKQAKILNSEKENPVDFVTEKEGEEGYAVKTVGAESDTKLEDDIGVGEVVSIRFFDFKANPEGFKDKLPTPQELFNAHAKQIEFELWKDEWKPVVEVEPRLMFAKDKSHYRIVVAVEPVTQYSKNMLGLQAKTLSQINDTTKNSN